MNREKETGELSSARADNLAGRGLLRGEIIGKGICLLDTNRNGFPHLPYRVHRTAMLALCRKHFPVLPTSGSGGRISRGIYYFA
ncbi:hypothetical protein JXI42_08340 [bacterium]|nr:hypothetical protein [bacterium]